MSNPCPAKDSPIPQAPCRQQPNSRRLRPAQRGRNAHCARMVEEFPQLRPPRPVSKPARRLRLPSSGNSFCSNLCPLASRFLQPAVCTSGVAAPRGYRSLRMVPALRGSGNDSRYIPFGPLGGEIDDADSHARTRHALSCAGKRRNLLDYKAGNLWQSRPSNAPPNKS